MSRQQAFWDIVGYMLKNIDNQTTDGEEKNPSREVIKIGIGFAGQAGHRSVVNWTVQRPSRHKNGILGSC